MRRRKDILTAYLFLLPAVVIFLALVVYPIVFSGFASLTKWKYTRGLNGMRWVGVSNYIKLFSDKNFRMAVSNTFIYTLVSVPISIVLSLTLAFMLNNKVFLPSILRMFYFIPYIANTVAVAALFNSWFRTDGIINSALGALFGVGTPVSWLGDKDLCKIPILFMLVWTSLGYLIIIYMGALQNVPGELYEASEIDGAGKLRQFVHVTVPLVSQTTFYLLIVRMIAVFKVFTSVNLLAMRTPTRYNTSIVVEIYNTAFADYNFGRASAQSWVLVAIILFFTAIQFLGQKKWVHY